MIAYVTRERDGRLELLVFEHRDFPEAGTQVPAGRIDPGETLEEGLLRELREESGLERARVERELVGAADWLSSTYETHAFQLVLDEQIPEAWHHVVRGDGDDAGLVFCYRWVPLEPDLELWGRSDPALAAILAARRHAASRTQR